MNDDLQRPNAPIRRELRALPELTYAQHVELVVQLQRLRRGRSTERERQTLQNLMRSDFRVAALWRDLDELTEEMNLPVATQGWLGAEAGSLTTDGTASLAQPRATRPESRVLPSTSPLSTEAVFLASGSVLVGFALMNLLL